jgi:DNA-binding winged helix-turn-helix (wHTH) protein/TolB-like protein
VSQEAKHCYYFGPFRLNAEERLLLRNSEAVSLPPKTLDLLLVLVENRGHLLEKGELMRRLWPDSFVEEANLSHHVFTLRKALSDGENGATYIETVPRRGYRFVADVKEGRDGRTDLISGTDSWSHAVPGKETEISSQLEPVRSEKSSASETSLSKNASWATKRNIGLLALLFLGGLISGILLFKSGRDARGRSDLERVRSIAVLPFRGIGLENTEEDLGLLMADAVITRLGSLDRIIVRPTYAIFEYQSRNQDPLAAGRELRVDAVLAGSTQRSGDRMRLTVQLIRTSDGTTLWTGKFDEKATDLFALQDSVAEAVARSLLHRLTNEQERQLARRYTDDIRAYSSCIKGSYFLEQWEPKKAREYFEHAIEQDPGYALAYVGLGDVYLHSFTELPATTRRSRGLELVSRGLSMDETLAEGHASLAMVKIFYDWDWPGAQRELERALQLNPNAPWTHLLYARYWQALGRLDRAVVEIKRAQELDPLSVKFLLTGGEIYLGASQYDRAIQQFKMSLDLNQGYEVPTHYLPITYEWLVEAYERAGMDENALSARQKAFSLSGEKELLEALNDVYSRHGYREARRVVLEKKLRQLEVRSKREFVSPIFLALAYGTLGYRDQTLKWLEKTCQERELAAFAINNRLEFAHLRTEPRFLALLKMMNMPAEVVLP